MFRESRVRSGPAFLLAHPAGKPSTQEPGRRLCEICSGYRSGRLSRARPRPPLSCSELVGSKGSATHVLLGFLGDFAGLPARSVRGRHPVGPSWRCGRCLDGRWVGSPSARARTTLWEHWERTRRGGRRVVARRSGRL